MRRRWESPLSTQARRAIVVSCGASPQRAAGDFLVGILAAETAELATEALGALATSRFCRELRAAAERTVRTRRDPTMTQAFTRAFAVSPGR